MSSDIECMICNSSGKDLIPGYKICLECMELAKVSGDRIVIHRVTGVDTCPVDIGIVRDEERKDPFPYLLMKSISKEELMEEFPDNDNES